MVEAHLRRIEALNPALNAFVHLDGERALDAARALDRRLAAGDEAGPLAGVPLSIKSSIDVAGLRCEAGSRLREGWIPAQDAPLVARLKSAGAIVLGVTNVPELLMCYDTNNAIYGVSSNPWNVACSPGGSSGGEAAAIAAGLSAGGVGSDGGGSIRVPAHFTGICGLKPTPGRIPGTGHFPECGGPWAMMGVVGPMARSVADLRRMWTVMAGPDDGDPMAAPVADEPSRAIRGQRIAMLDFDGVSDATQSALKFAAAALERAGALLEPLRLEGLEAALELWRLLVCSASAVLIRALSQGREGLLSRELREFLAYAQSREPLTVESVLFNLVERDRLRARMLGQLRSYAAVLVPVSNGPAFAKGDGGWGAAHRADYTVTMRPSQLANIMGFPAATVPAGQSAEGLPIGVQVIGKPYGETAVLDVCDVIEAAREFRWPALALGGEIGDRQHSTATFSAE